MTRPAGNGVYIMYGEYMAHCRTAFGAPRRQFTYQDVGVLQVPPPRWLPADDRREMHYLFQGLPWVFAEGHLRWGTIVQANQLCWKEGPDDCPACVIHSADPFYDDNPELLHDIGHQLYENKGRYTKNPELQRFADLLENELDAQMRLPVPKFMTEGRDVIYTTIYVFRRHLPLPYLVEPIVPIVVHPNTGHSAILPSAWWPQGLIDEWMDNAR